MMKSSSASSLSSINSMIAADKSSLFPTMSRRSGECTPTGVLADEDANAEGVLADEDAEDVLADEEDAEEDAGVFAGAGVAKNAADDAMEDAADVLVRVAAGVEDDKTLLLLLLLLSMTRGTNGLARGDKDFEGGSDERVGEEWDRFEL